MKKLALFLFFAAPVFAQTVIPFRTPRATFATSTGQPLSGGCIFTYQGGTTTPQSTYTDYTGGTPNTNPVILDTTGSAVMWLGANSYKFAAYSAGGVNCASGSLQWTVDNVTGNSFGGTISGATIANPTITGGTDTGTSFSSAVLASSSINSTPIGSITPAAGSFSTITGALNGMSFSATPTFNANAYSHFSMTLTGNVTSSTISGGNAGQEIDFRFCQDATGGRTFAWPGSVSVPPAVNLSPNACTSAILLYDGANWVNLYSNSALLIGAYDAVAFSANPAFNAAAYTHFAMTLTGNVTSSTLTGGTAGQIVTLELCEDGTGGRTIAWPANLLNAPVVGTNANYCNTLAAYYDGSNWNTISALTANLSPNPNTPSIAFTSPAAGSLGTGSNDFAGILSLTNVGSGSSATVFTLTYGGTYNHVFCVVADISPPNSAFTMEYSTSPTSLAVQNSGTGGALSVVLEYICHQ